mgnify:CR=1 FL=1
MTFKKVHYKKIIFCKDKKLFFCIFFKNFLPCCLFSCNTMKNKLLQIKQTLFSLYFLY